MIHIRQYLYILIIHLLLFVKDDVVETSSKDYGDRKDLENAPGIQVNVKETSSQCKCISNNYQENTTLI